MDFGPGKGVVHAGFISAAFVLDLPVRRNQRDAHLITAIDRKPVWVGEKIVIFGDNAGTLQKALHWLQRQVAPTIKMVQALDRENHTTILKDMIEQAELKDKHKHLLQLEKSTIEERIDTAVPQENDGIF